MEQIYLEESTIDVIDDGIVIPVNNEQLSKLLISIFFCDNKSLIISWWFLFEAIYNTVI